MAATQQQPNSSSSSSLRRSLSDSNTRRRQRRRGSISTASSSSKSSWSTKLAKLLARLNLFSRNSDLTEESLQAHNERIDDLDKTPLKSSPYYRGLTDSSLAINYHHGPLTTGPHHYASSTTTAQTQTSLSYAVVSKLKEWAPCLIGKPNTKPPAHQQYETPTTTTVVGKTTSLAVSSSPEKIERWATEKEEKLLRERLVMYGRREGGSGVGVDGGGEAAEKERYTWGDKYRPKVLEDFICNRKTACELKKVVEEKGCGHYIFEGPPGVGKRTMIQAMLRQAFGEQAMEVKEVDRVFALKSEMVGSIEVKVKESSHCVEVNLSQTKGFEKQVIDQLIKETQSPLPCNHARCRGILLCEADQLSNETLMYVKWAIERNKGCSKIFFCCSDVSKLLLLSSFCTHVHLSPPSKQEIVEVLEYIAKQQEFDLSRRMAERIADNSKNNLRQAIRSLEASWKKSRLFEEDENKLLTGWEDDIADVAKKIVEEQSPKQLYIVRGKLKKLIEYDVSPNFIFKTLVDELKKFLDEELQHRVESFYADYNKMEEKPFVTEKGNGEEAVIKELHDPMRKNVNHFLKIEEFIAKFMSCYKGEANKNNYLLT
ncbi:replication factor C subunit 3-like [Cucurbita moschata]|uniref:Replication factor C subunit 3-like n=1 Tax=Cucurbita moschata TaxID=3662 RepID=A0A6J1G337_CUCMO|nr:replication factor C subunit 3-like [Cucurbita moschata]